MTADRPLNQYGHDQIDERVAFYAEHGITDPIVFTPRLFTKVTFPHSARAANNKVIDLHNGNLHVGMSNALDGLPYGHYARLVLFWLTKEACRRCKNVGIDDIDEATELDLDLARTIPLGDSAHRILREMNIVKPGQRAGKNHYTALARQIKRIMHTTISVRYDTDTANCVSEDTESYLVGEHSHLLWQKSAMPEKFDNGSHIVLTEAFFKELVKHTVPLDAIHVRKLHRSSLALDLYAWLSHRLYTHRGKTHVTWGQLRGQIGLTYADTDQGMRNFRVSVRKAIAKVKEAWPEAGISEWSGGVLLSGSITPIAPKLTQQNKEQQDDGRPKF